MSTAASNKILFDSLNPIAKTIALEKSPVLYLITSAKIGEGKSTIASNLALTLSYLEKKTVLIDCNFKRPAIHFIFDVDNSCGITDFVSLRQNQVHDRTKIPDNLLPGDIRALEEKYGSFLKIPKNGDSEDHSNSDLAIPPTLIKKSDSLSVITIGRNVHNPDFSGLEKGIAKIKSLFDYIIIDSMELTDETISLSKIVNRIILVLNMEMTSRTDLESAQNRLDVNKVAGIIVNMYKTEK